MLRSGQVHLLPGNQVKLGDALPVPRRVPAPSRPLQSLNLISLLRTGSPDLKRTASVTMNRGLPFPDEWESIAAPFYAKPHQKLWRMRVQGEGMSLAAGAALLDRQSVVLSNLRLQGGRYCRSAEMEISRDLSTLWGQYLAEGHASHGFALLSVRDPEVQQEVQRCLVSCLVPFFRRPDGDFVVGERVWRDMLFLLMGSGSATKHMPSCWTALSNHNLAAMLRGYFEGDGGMDGGTVTATTSQPDALRMMSQKRCCGSAFGRGYALSESASRTAKWATISRSQFRAQTTSNIFLKRLALSAAARHKALHASLHTGNTNVDLIFGVGPRLKQERLRLGLHQRDAAERGGLLPSYDFCD